MGCGSSAPPKEDPPMTKVISSPKTANTLNAQARAAAVPVSKQEEIPELHPSTMANTDWKKKRDFEKTDPMDWTIEMVSSWIGSVQEGAFERYCTIIEAKKTVGWQLLKFERADMKRVLNMKKSNHLVTFKLCLKKLRQTSEKYKNDEWPPEANPKPVEPEPVEPEKTIPDTPATETSNETTVEDTKAESTLETVDLDVQNTEVEVTEVKLSEPEVEAAESVKIEETEPANTEKVEKVLVDELLSKEELEARKEIFKNDASENVQKEREVVETGLSKEEIENRKRKLLVADSAETERVTSVDTGLSEEELKKRKQLFKNANATGAPIAPAIHVTQAPDAMAVHEPEKELVADAKANEKVEEVLDFSNVKNFTGFEEKKVEKTKTEEDVKQAHKVTAFEGLKFHEIKKDENLQKDAEKLADTKLVSKSIFHQMEHQPEESEDKHHNKSVLIPRKIKKVKSVFHKMEHQEEDDSHKHHNKSVMIPRKIKKVKSVFHKMEHEHDHSHDDHPETKHRRKTHHPKKGHSPRSKGKHVENSESTSAPIVTVTEDGGTKEKEGAGS